MEKDQKQIKRFVYDRWEDAPVSELTVGDTIFNNSHAYKLTEPPFTEEGKTVLRAEKLEELPIVVMLYGGPSEALATVMDYTNSGCINFDDGTHMIAELDMGPGAVFSPRLSLSELEAWCQENELKFEAHYSNNFEAIDAGQIVKIDPWWL